MLGGCVAPCMSAKDPTYGFLVNETLLRVTRAVAELGEPTRDEIAARIGVGYSTAQWHVERLARAGILTGRLCEGKKGGVRRFSLARKRVVVDFEKGVVREG